MENARSADGRPLEATPTSQTKTRLCSALRSQSGAFDLTSVLVGSAVVAILVGGVATNAFGVIPWAHDNAARQELDVIRTAQGAAKVREGRFSNNAALGASGYLTSADGVATASDEAGSCYTSVSKSSSNKVFISTSNATAPVEFTSPTQQTCLPTIEMMSLLGSTAGATFVPLTVSNGYSKGVVDAFNAEMAMEASAANFAANTENTDEAWAAWESAEGTVAFNAAYSALVDDIDDYINYQQMLNRKDGGVREAGDAMRSASSDFYSGPTKESQQAYLDAMRHYFKLALDQPIIPLVDDAAYTPIPVTPGAEKEARYANAVLAYVSSRELLYFGYGHVNQWVAFPIYDAWMRTPEGVEWNAVGYDPVRFAMAARKDSGIPALYATMIAKQTTYEAQTPTRTVEQAVVQRQEYMDALLAYFAVTTKPAP
jgi:hypothetical protein